MGRHKRRQKSERGRLFVAVLNGQSGIDVFVVLYVQGITGGSGMQQAFGCFEGSCRRKEEQRANERQVGGACQQERSVLVSEWKEATTNGVLASGTIKDSNGCRGKKMIEVRLHKHQIQVGLLVAPHGDAFWH